VTRKSETDANRKLSASKWTAKWGVPVPPKQSWITLRDVFVALIVLGAAFVAGQWLIIVVENWRAW
jgi:hypothetical protein